ncbi:hypothetical protein NLG97_g11106 [Lecanicillium saksenae]|uniref:Uncharacterized protein n=1 Tax=Lecanicillium saksenae TaxID=468837 RepID=A0ACC1QBC4_9HYPO|nr:hypothetical protein NLG97_g11106 [Lecanicillium saksenae]
MARYKICTYPEMAAVLALMAFESVDFRYKHNSLDGVKDKVADVQSVDGLPPDKLNYILSLVQPDEYNFGSGPWFLTTQCKPEVREALKANVDSGFEAYMACVGVSVTDERKAYLTRAKKAFGLS